MQNCLTMHHREQDARSPALHNEAIELMRADETLIATEDGGLPMLKERQRKDAEDVATGCRTARSLLAVGRGDLRGAKITQNPASEFERSGDGW